MTSRLDAKFEKLARDPSKNPRTIDGLWADYFVVDDRCIATLTVRNHLCTLWPQLVMIASELAEISELDVSSVPVSGVPAKQARKRKAKETRKAKALQLWGVLLVATGQDVAKAVRIALDFEKMVEESGALSGMSDSLLDNLCIRTGRDEWTAELMSVQPKRDDGDRRTGQHTFVTLVFSIGAAKSLLKSIWPSMMVIVRGL